MHRNAKILDRPALLLRRTAATLSRTSLGLARRQSLLAGGDCSRWLFSRRLAVAEGFARWYVDLVSGDDGVPVFRARHRSARADPGRPRQHTSHLGLLRKRWLLWRN